MEITPPDNLSPEEQISRWNQLVDMRREGKELGEELTRYAVELIAAIRKTTASAAKSRKASPTVKKTPPSLDALTAALE